MTPLVQEIIYWLNTPTNGSNEKPNREWRNGNIAIRFRCSRHTVRQARALKAQQDEAQVMQRYLEAHPSMVGPFKAEWREKRLRKNLRRMMWDWERQAA